MHPIAADREFGVAQGERRRRRLEARAAVTYAMGGAYGLSREAVARLVASRCMSRVGALSCPTCKRSIGTVGMHHHEDANMGCAAGGGGGGGGGGWWWW